MTDTKINENVYNSMAVLEQFELLVSNLESYCMALPTEHQEELKLHVQTLKTMVELIDIDGSTVISQEKLSGNLPKSKIERYGMGGELIRLRREGKTLNELATQFGFNNRTIARFFKLYDEALPKRKLELQRTSIFDSSQQMEDLSALIHRSMARLEGANDEVNVKYVAELRQLIELAMKFAEKMANYEKFEMLKNITVDILATELPHRRVEILQKISTSFSVSPQALAEAQVEHQSS